jgi:hypothetical protein
MQNVKQVKDGIGNCKMADTERSGLFLMFLEEELPFSPFHDSSVIEGY